MPDIRRKASGLERVPATPIELTQDSLGHTHLTETSTITDVLLGDYHLVSGEGITGQYIVWTIRIVIDDALRSLIVLFKRYSDIERLRYGLQKAFPDEYLPEFPPKDSLSLQRLWRNEGWLEKRRRGLQWFLTNVLLNPKFHHSQVITDFVLS